MANSEKDKSFVPTEETKLTSKEMSKRRIFLSRLKRKLFKHVWVIRILILSGIILFTYSLFHISSQFIKGTRVPYYYDLVSNFVFSPKGVVREMDGRTNILLLGKGGEGHEAPDLTDTILFLSLDHRDKKVTMISLPRDIWLPDLRTKLNSAYYWGNKKEPPARASGLEAGGGIVLTKASVEEILGQHVHYAVVLDFSGFKKIIDVLGGVEVDVEVSFVDKKYPIPGREDDLCDGDPEYGCRYETLHFVQGKQVMDGETALKFARSRNAEGDEGTDFARQKRQQKIIEAVKSKILDRSTLLSPKKLLEIKEAFLSTLETDIGENEGAVLARGFLNSKDNISSYVLPEELLINPLKSAQYDNLYVFIPKDEGWGEVHKWVMCALSGGECP